MKTAKIEPKIMKTATKKTRIAKRLPNLKTMFEDEGDPLEDVEYNDADLEASADAEMTEIVKQIKERKRQMQERFRVANDTDYWFAMCFQSREQRDEFLRLTGWAAPGEKYLSGLKVAQVLGVEIGVIELDPKPLRGKPRKYTRKEVI